MPKVWHGTVRPGSYRTEGSGGASVAVRHIAVVPAGEGLFGPDGLAVRGLSGPPALGEPGDEQQAAAGLVEGAGRPEVRSCAAAVGDLADEPLVPDEPQLDRTHGVPDRVGDEFGDDEAGDERRAGEPPAGEPSGHLFADVGDDR